MECIELELLDSKEMLAKTFGGSLATLVAQPDIVTTRQADAPPQRKVHVLVVTSAYWPERTGTAPLNNELCAYLASRGHRVSVATGFPHYPAWKVYPEYRGKIWQRESHDGVDIYRGLIYVPPQRSTWRRILYDTTVGMTGLVRSLPIGDVDIVLAVSPPLQGGLAGCMLAALKRVPLILDIHDLVPDLAVAVGMMKEGWAVKAARVLEKFVYRHSDGIVVISEEFSTNLFAKGVPPPKVTYLPLWVDSQSITPQDRNGPFRQANGIDTSKTVALYTGNHGAKQALENILEAAARLKSHEDLLFLFVGDGFEKKRLQEIAQQRYLNNVRFLPLVPPSPEELLPQMLASSDMLLLNQSAGVVDTVIPSKLFTYMASGRPIIAAVSASSQAANCVRRAGSGIAVPAEQPAALAEAILKLKQDRQLAEMLGSQGRNFVVENCDRNQILRRYEDIFLAFAKRRSPGPIPQPVSVG
jgi:colanic acid biosynthesis glycosyl transferase WcaI